MTISVVIPAYNEEKYLPACLESLKNQTKKPNEIIVVDNNSKDKTAEIAKKYGVDVLTESEQGITPARNKGFNATKSDIIARIDSDTRLPRDWIERIKNYFEKDPKLLAVSGPSDFYDAPYLLKNHNSWITIGCNTGVKIFTNHDALLGFNMAIKKSIWNVVKNEICQNDKEFHEDIDLSMHIARYGKIYFDKSLIVQTSFRRNYVFHSYFEYPYKYFKTIKSHKFKNFHS